MDENTAAAATPPVQTEDFTREDYLELFIDVLTLCRPEHPYYSETDPYDGLTSDQIDFRYCKSTSTTWARCGPRRGSHIVMYAIDFDYFKSVSFERVLAITTHEITHIPIGTQNGPRAPMHPPAFWNEMAYHAQIVLDNLDSLSADWGVIREEVFRQKIINDPNDHMVDKRSESVEDVRGRLQKWVGGYSPDE